MSTGKESAPAPVVLCVGPERWLRARAVEEVRRRCVSAGFEETDFVRFAQPPDGADVVLNALRTAPFGSPRRLVVLDGVEELTSETVPWLAGYLERPNPAACAVICASSAAPGVVSPEQRRSGRAQWLDCQPLKARALEEWVEAQAAGIGHRIDREAVSLLVRRLGENLQALALAVESLSLLAGPSAPITAAQVRSLIPSSVRETAFDILDSAAAGRPAAAVAALRQALATGQLTLDQFFGAVGWQIRSAVKGRRMARRGAEQALENLVRADVRFKQGDPDPEGLAERLLLDLVSQPAQTRNFS